MSECLVLCRHADMRHRCAPQEAFQFIWQPEEDPFLPRESNASIESQELPAFVREHGSLRLSPLVLNTLQSSTLVEDLESTIASYSQSGRVPDDFPRKLARFLTTAEPQPTFSTMKVSA